MKTKDITTIALMATAITVAKEFNPISWYNIGTTTTLFIVTGFVLGIKRGVAVAYLFAFLQVMLHPAFLKYINAFVLYLTIWPLIVVMTCLLRKVLYGRPILIGVFAVVMTIIFKIIDVTGYWWLTGVHPIVYMARSPIHYIAHPISNYIVASLLVMPLVRQLEKFNRFDKGGISNGK